MRDLAERLRQQVEAFPEAPVTARGMVPSVADLWRTVQTRGERAAAGMKVGRPRFEATRRHGTVLRVFLEGRDALRVAGTLRRQIVEHPEVREVSVVRTRAGACVLVLPVIEEN